MNNQLHEHPELYRAQLSCKVARDALDGKTGKYLLKHKIDVPSDNFPMDFAFYNLCHAVEEIAGALMKIEDRLVRLEKPSKMP
jgi:hypothetical protein